MNRTLDGERVGIEIEIPVSVRPHDRPARPSAQTVRPRVRDRGVGVEARVAAEVVGGVLLVGGAGGEDVGRAADGAGGAEEVGAVGHGAGDADGEAVDVRDVATRSAGGHRVAFYEAVAGQHCPVARVGKLADVDPATRVSVREAETARVAQAAGFVSKGSAEPIIVAEIA